MGQILLFIIALVVIIVGFVLVISRREAGKYGTSAGEEFVGICKSAVETASQKEGRKEKALAMFAEKPELSNAEIRAALGVSSRTAVRYLDELEKEGKVEQVGKVGHAVTYRLK
ncbi:MAG: HTH domain-containing protein [Candidatus Yanofskybacteria bacterium]|nr:HTH domain-containing protein [Candidatus Yanofskybacteria bacterium]